MESINGVSLKKLVEFGLAILALVLFLVAGSQTSKTRFLYFLILCIAAAYLSLVVLMACLSRDIGASPAIEGATGVMLTAHSLEILINSSVSGTEMGAVISTTILGIMLLLFLLF